MSNQKISFEEIGIEVESRLSFKPDPNVLNGLSCATIDTLELVETEVPIVNSDGTPNTNEFAGKTIPSIKIVFKQVNSDPKDTSARYITLSENITYTKKNNGETMEVDVWANFVTAQYKRLQHIVNAFDNGGLQPKSTKLSKLDIEFNDVVDARITKMRKFYTHFYNQLVGDPKKPKYINDNGTPVKFWLVVVASAKTGTFYEIPTFIEKGIIEVAKTGIMPSIEIANKYTVILSKKGGDKSVAKADMSYEDKDAVVSSTDSADDIVARLLAQS